MLEIEQKFRVRSFAALEQWLADHEVRADEPRHEVDLYFNAPDRDFARTGEAFRMRRVGSSSWLTYKGPRQQGPVKVRKELELAIPDGEASARAFTELFGCLGYRQVASVRKRRRCFPLERGGFAVTVSLDDVETLGLFVEVEIVAPEEHAAAARDAIVAVADELGLEGLEPRSYLRMVLEARSPEGDAP